MSKIVASSKEKDDGMYNSLLLDVQAHKSCYCNYTSKSRYCKFAKRNAAAESWDAGGKRQLKSNARDFVFKRDCLLCGQVCVPKDHKNPHRWVRVNQCRTVDRGDGVLTFREQLEYTCKERGDGWSSEVSLRLSGVSGDLHASDA